MARKAKTKEVAETGSDIIIEGVGFTKRPDGLPEVPDINPAYQWHPRTFDICKDLIENKWIMLTGHAGTGKSSIVEQIAARIGQPCVRPAVGGQMTMSELVGFWTVKGGETIWIDGILVKAMKEGWWLIVDEIDFVDPNIMSALNKVLEPVKPHDPHRKLLLKEKGHETIVAHPDFRIVTTANTVGAMQQYRHLYQGAMQMNYALLTRARIYVVDYLPKDTEIQVLMKRFDRFELIPDLAVKMVEVANLIRDGFKNQELSEPFSLRQLEDWAEMLFRHVDRYAELGKTIDSKATGDILMSSADAVILSRTDAESTAVIKGIMERVLLTEE